MRNAAAQLKVIAGPDAVAVSSVNVVDYREFQVTDPKALDAANQNGVAVVASLELPIDRELHQVERSLPTIRSMRRCRKHKRLRETSNDQDSQSKSGAASPSG